MNGSFPVLAEEVQSHRIIVSIDSRIIDSTDLIRRNVKTEGRLLEERNRRAFQRQLCVQAVLVLSRGFISQLVATLFP